MGTTPVLACTCAPVCKCVPGPPTQDLLSLACVSESTGAPALMGPGLSSGRDTGEDKHLGCVLRASDT